MSEAPATECLPARYGWIRARWFLGGLLLSLGALAWSGERISRTDYHPGFVRFHSMISPEGSYYPTLDEMSAIVRARCRAGQILVIVGGNSILVGVWQRAADVWSKRLQELLGERYCVINFAFRGGSPTDGGAVVAEALRREFPRQILVVNEAVLSGVESFGREPYRYLFWQAYLGGRLIDTPSREHRIREFLQFHAEQRSRFLEDRIGAWFDAALHDRDFWNWVSFKHVGTAPSYLETCFPGFLRPRSYYPDPEVDGTDPEYADQHYRPAYLEAEMRILRAPALFYHPSPGGRWMLAQATRADLTTRCAEAFPAPLKPRTLVLISGNSPYYRALLSPQEAAIERQAYQDTVEIWRQTGYPSMDYGWDYNAADFGDRIHLTKLGGWKLAAQVAPQVQAIAQRLGYQ